MILMFVFLKRSITTEYTVAHLEVVGATNT